MSLGVGATQGATARCVAVGFGAWALVPLQGAAAGCFCEMPLAVCALDRRVCGHVRFGAWMLGGAAAESLGAGAAAPCRCRVHEHAISFVNGQLQTGQARITKLRSRPEGGV